MLKGLVANSTRNSTCGKTAKPYLERWMQEQIGWRALLRNVKEQAPYWAEKLPEMPGLLYDNIATDAKRWPQTT